MRLQTTREIVRFVSFPTRDPGDSFLDEYDDDENDDDDVGIDPLVPLATSVGDVRRRRPLLLVLLSDPFSFRVVCTTYVASKVDAT